MPYTIYRSTDTGAPTLNGTAGSLITVLDACLVTGYGSKAGAGWTKEFAGTNKAVYRNASTAEARSFYRIVDAATSHARVRGFHEMTDVDTGTGGFPSPTVVTGDGNPVRKSSTSDTVARSWILLADERTMALLVQPAGVNWQCMLYMGDGISDVAGDTNFAVLNSQFAEAEYANSMFSFREAAYTQGDINVGLFTKGMPGVLGSKPMLLPVGPSIFHAQSSSMPLAGNVAMPSGGAIHLWPLLVVVHDGTSYVTQRGTLRFFYMPRHWTPAFSHGDTFSGTGTLSNKRFEIVKPVVTWVSGGTSTAGGSIAFVTQNPD